MSLRILFLVIAGDKDSSHTIMSIEAYQSEAKTHMSSCAPNAISQYVKLGCHDSGYEWWLELAIKVDGYNSPTHDCAPSGFSCGFH